MSEHDIQLLLFDLALIVVLARLLGIAAKRIGQPPVIGEIVAGVLLGPTIADGKLTAALFPMTLKPALVAIADVGLVLFMFVVGYEVDLTLIRGRERVHPGPADVRHRPWRVAGVAASPGAPGHLHAVLRNRDVDHRVPGAGSHPDRPRLAPNPGRRPGPGQRLGR